MSSLGTIATWCVPREKSLDTEFQGHFNYWRISGDETFVRPRDLPVEDFIEVGILICDILQVDQVCIYLPVSLTYANVDDCAKYFENTDFAQGIFNEVLAITKGAPGGKRCVTLHDQDSAIFCRVHIFGKDGDNIDKTELEIDGVENGSVLKITRAALDRACSDVVTTAPTYFRLRITLKKGQINPFVTVIRARDRLFQSGSDEIEYIDFRVNEARTLPQPIEQRMQDARKHGGTANLTLIAFLTAVPVHSELSASHAPLHKMRLLEENWRNYVKGGIPNDMVVYHWKRIAGQQRSIADFSAFVKLRTRRSDWHIVSKYLIIAFFLGLLGNLTASAIICCAQSVWAHFSSVAPNKAASMSVKPTPITPSLPKPESGAKGNGP